MRAQGRRWLLWVHKLIRPAAKTVERMQKEASKVDSKKKIACHETDKPLRNSEGVASLSHASEGPVLLSRTYPLIYRIEANISAWLESFYIAKNRKAQVFPRPGKGFGVGSYA